MEPVCIGIEVSSAKGVNAAQVGYVYYSHPQIVQINFEKRKKRVGFWYNETLCNHV